MTAVHNHLEVVLPPGDYRYAMLTTAANNALTQNVLNSAARDRGDRPDGNVELIGEVRYGSQRLAAEKGSRGATRRPQHQELHRHHPRHQCPPTSSSSVQEVLGPLRFVDDHSNVAVTISDTTVTLTGNVRTWAEHDAVVDAAWMAAGIADVHDELSVTG